MITILKHRTPPLSLRFLDTLLPRLHKHYPQLDSLKKQTAILQKGYNGERKLDYHLQLLPDYFSILSDISLHHKQSTFQIDSLILSEHAIFMIDSKSIDGEITFDTKLQQLIQSHKQRVNSYKYPITQERQSNFY